MKKVCFLTLVIARSSECTWLVRSHDHMFTRKLKCIFVNAHLKQAVLTWPSWVLAEARAQQETHRVGESPTDTKCYQ